MTALAIRIDIPAFDPISYEEALRKATLRAQHSFFDSHVIENDDGSYSTIDEGDYNTLTQDLIDRIVYTVQGMMADEYDAKESAISASYFSVAIDPEWDAADLF